MNREGRVQEPLSERYSKAAQNPKKIWLCLANSQQSLIYHLSCLSERTVSNTRKAEVKNMPVYFITFLKCLSLSTVFTSFQFFTLLPLIPVSPDPLSNSWPPLPWLWWFYTHTQLCLFIIAPMYMCLGLITWDWVIKGFIPGENQFSLPQQSLIASC